MTKALDGAELRRRADLLRPAKPVLTDASRAIHDANQQALREVIDPLPRQEELEHPSTQWRMEADATAALGGVNEKRTVIATLADGREVRCIAKPLAGRERLFVADEFVAKLRAMLGQASLPVARVTLRVDGAPAEHYVKPFIPLTGDRTQDRLATNVYRWGSSEEMNQDIYRVVLQDILLMELVGQFDGKLDQYIRPSGAGGLPYNTDYDQAFRDFVEEDPLSRHEHQTLLGTPPAFQRLLKKYVQGRLELDWTAMLHTAEAMANLDEGALRELAAPLAQRMLQDPQLGQRFRDKFGTADAIIDELIHRKRTAPATADAFIQALQTERLVGRGPSDFLRDAIPAVSWWVYNDERLQPRIYDVMRFFNRLRTRAA